MSYRRLLPRERNLFWYAELWAGDDHLLAVYSRRVNVGYQRFPFAEIQAVSVTQLPHWTWPQIAGALAAAVFFGLSTLVPSWLPVRLTFAAVTLWPLLYVARELWRGPKCRARIHTATGAHDLRAVARMSRAPLFLETVTPLIEAAQGRVEILRVPASPAVDPEADARERLAKERPVRLAAWTLTLLSDIHTVASWKWAARLSRVESLGILVGLAAVVLLVVAWRNSTPAMRRLRPYVWMSIVFAWWFLGFLAGVIWLTASIPGMQELQLVLGGVGAVLSLIGLAIEFATPAPREGEPAS